MHHKLIFVLTYFLPYVFWIRVIWVILIGLGITNDLSAQESTRLHLAVGPQLSHHILQDEGMSLSRYAGTQSGAFLALEKRKKQRLSLITWNAGSGNIKAVGRQGARVNRAEQNFFEANYLFLTELKATQEKARSVQFGLMAGGIIRSRNNHRLANSSRTYEGLVYLGPSVGLSGTWEWTEKKLPWRFYLGIPVVAGVVRPSLTNLRDFFDPQIPDFQSRWEQHGWTSLGSSFAMLKSGAEIIYPISNTRQIRCNYQWEYFNYNKVNRIQAAMHQLSVSYAFSLK